MEADFWYCKGCFEVDRKDIFAGKWTAEVSGQTVGENYCLKGGSEGVSLKKTEKDSGPSGIGESLVCVRCGEAPVLEESEDSLFCPKCLEMDRESFWSGDWSEGVTLSLIHI